MPLAASAVYGPVFSWRFGNSIGVDLLLHDSICSFRCVYCQLGTINVVTRERQVWVPTATVLSALHEAEWRGADVVTFSGSGEPTLARNLGEALRAVKQATGKPVVVLTNGTLLGDPGVAEELSVADHVSCKLDAATENLMMKVNRPAPGLDFGGLLRGIIAFRERFAGIFSIQTMLLPSNVKRAGDFVPVLEEIRPDVVYLNVPSRCSPVTWRQELRGEHQSFAGERAFRIVGIDEILAFRNEIESRIGAGVAHLPPSPREASARERPSR
jgi:wyosine [tRNA(Phe)-imidazoG37] synthetase (radical SAM superfamily)